MSLSAALPALTLLNMVCAYRDTEARGMRVAEDFADFAESPAASGLAVAEKLRRVEGFLAAGSFYPQSPQLSAKLPQPLRPSITGFPQFPQNPQLLKPG